MKKIASPQDLRVELQQLLSHCQGQKSLSRGRVAATLNAMADRLVEAKLAGPEAKAAKELDKKLQSLMQQALLSPRQVGALQKAIEATLKKHPSKQAGLVTAMDSDQEAIYDAVWMIASNDGDSYRKKDARGAVKKAWMEWQKTESRQNREDFRAVEKKLVKDLGDRWNKGEV